MLLGKDREPSSPQVTLSLAFAGKLCLQAAQKDLRGEAREKSILRLRSGQARRRRTQSVRWSEAIERNEAYESFSAVC
jgi:hypothetical protein